METSRWNAFIATILFLSVIYQARFSLAKRCDRVVYNYAYSTCMECSMNALDGLAICPTGYSKDTTGEGLRGCTFRIHFGPGFGYMYVPGCRHRCAQSVVKKECCKDYWGPDCQACPGWPSCSGHGSCSDRVHGNGTCSCKIGFKGFACELCSNPTKFGLHCNNTCTCVHGECSSGVNGSGHCQSNSCHLGFAGQDCNISLPSCLNVQQCQSNASCFRINSTDTCVCNPGYRNSSNKCTAINPCSDKTHYCHQRADCINTGPGKHNCTCAAGYSGDGVVCEAIDPCQKNNGGCPSNSTACNYLAPGKSVCSCLPGFENRTSHAGCSLVDLCENGGGCDVNANCTMEGPGMKRCSCIDGFRGNGTVCYGNILQRVVDLHIHGPIGLRGGLSLAIDLLKLSFARPLSAAGPFTLFLVVDSTFSNLTQAELHKLKTNQEIASHFVRHHVVAQDLDSSSLKTYKKVTTLQGFNVSITEHQNATFIMPDTVPENARILFPDLLAGNGIIHVIDRMMWRFKDFKNTSSESSLLFLLSEARFSTFVSFLQLYGVASEIAQIGGAHTIFAPVNSTFDKLDIVTLNYLETDMGKEKMKSLLRNHVLSSKVKVTDLIYRDKVTSLEGESLLVQLTSKGQIALDEHATVTDTNILTNTGVIHVIDSLLIPDDIQPLVKNICNKKVDSRGLCYRCEFIDVIRNKGCQLGYKPSSENSACQYVLRYGGFIIGVYDGCRASSCTAEVPECCAGFYGAVCHPCPGPFYNPCSGNGQCSDGIHGSGTCLCNPNFKGTACELCRDDNKFGPFCNQTCTCLKGKCDSGPTTNGTCKPNSCLLGYHGINCDQRDVPCPSSTSLRCHLMASCVREGNIDRCKCRAGYEGSGFHCNEIDPCSNPNRGGCHHEATCTKTGPGTNNCTCDDGFRGDGIVCVAVDPCQEVGGGLCHSNAECQYKGPGQSICICKPGFTGDGFTCYEINPCLVNNGGCSNDAKCMRTGPGNRTCQCNTGFIGNGFICLGSVATVISRVNLNLETLMRKGNMLHLLSDPLKNLTVLAPSASALSQLSDSDNMYWTHTTDRLTYLLKYHLLNHTYTFDELRNKTFLTVYNGLRLAVTNQGNKVLIGGTTEVVQANLTAANGLVHVIDKVLLPPRLPPGDELPLTSELLKNSSEFLDFYNVLKTFALLTSLDACDACTVFAPTNSALREHVLLLHRNLSEEAIEYHLVRQYISEESIQNGQEFPTFLKSGFVKVTKQSMGKLKVNGLDVIIKGQKARRAMVYGLNGVLEPIKSHCDESTPTYTFGGCTSCILFDPACPTGWTRVRVETNACWILFPLIRGCHALCRKDVTIKQCCPGFWGKDCQSCPGNLTVACSGQGKCDDGKAGNGHCVCHANFTGTSCEKCSAQRYGRRCDKECQDGTCVNGMCNVGKMGDGQCLCSHGWKGPHCNVSRNFSSCFPTVCSHHATCFGPTGSGTCQCDAGYTGNGTHCSEVNPCADNNGGCDQNAICSVNLKLSSFRSCKCKNGFSGDGFYCFAMDPCQYDNGGCHGNATCASVAPGKRNCFCKGGFSGDGISSCVGVNPCETDNGGCSSRAECKHVGPHARQCTCTIGYVGDGITCIGDVMEALQFDPQLSEVEKLVRKFGLDQLLTSHGFTNVLAPVNTALQKLSSSNRKRRSLESQEQGLEAVLKYHIISCVQITNATFQANSTNFTTLLGPPVTVKRQGSEVHFQDVYGNTSRVVGLYEAGNGFILKLDSVLTPPVTDSETKGSFIEKASKLGYTEFVKLVELAGLSNILLTDVARPALMFWPTNTAITSLPQDLRNRLLDPANVADLVNVLEYHIIMRIPNSFSTQSFLRSGAGMELRTVEGASLFVACGGRKGDLYVNGESRIVEREVTFDGGVAFGVDTVLIPLGFGGRCDVIRDTQFKGKCGNCFIPASCPQETSLVGMTNHGCLYHGDLLGCQPICLKKTRVQRCCTNYFGPDCLPCPGGIQSPCNRRGVCIDGLEGLGQCVCDSPFNGTACEKCADSSNSCTAPAVSCLDNNGGCHVYASCSKTADNHVNCTCKSGYHGDGFYCQMTDVCATNNGSCGINFMCRSTGPGTRTCTCKTGFYQVGLECRARQANSPCNRDHGGCSVYADCFFAGSGAICSCRPGFVGDGYMCVSDIVQVLKDTTDTLEFYKVLYQLSTLSSEGWSLFRDLENRSTQFTVFVPFDVAINPEKFTLQYMKNHILSGKVPLVDLVKQRSVKTLAGSSLLLKKLGNGQVLVNGVAHVMGDIPATNGLIHVIDQMIPIISPPAPTTAAPVKPTSTTEKPTTGQEQQTVTVSTESPSQFTTGAVSPARRQGSDSVGKGAIIGIIFGLILGVLVTAILVWFLKKRKFPVRALFKKEAATVQFSNEAFNDSSMMSFDNILYENFDDPVLLPPLEFPLDDKRPLPYQSAEHLDFENLLYNQVKDLDTDQLNDMIYGEQERCQDPDSADISFASQTYDTVIGNDRKDLKFTLDDAFVPGQEDTC